MAWLDEVLGRQKAKAPVKLAPRVEVIAPVPPDPIRDRLKQIEQQVETWANTRIVPVVDALEELLERIREKDQSMATEAEQKQAFDQMMGTWDEFRPVMEQFIPAVEGQTQKYKAVIEQLAATQAEKAQIEQARAAEKTQLEQERDDYKAKYERLNTVLAALHQATSQAKDNLAIYP